MWKEIILVLKKIGLFIKNYWLLFLLGVTIFYVLILAKKKQDSYNQLIKDFQETLTKHRQEVDELEKIHLAEVAKYAEIEKRYNETLAKIEKEHQDSLASLDRQKKTELKRIIEETANSPEEQTKRINSLFGIPIFPSSQ